jgi:hypothetical protein
MATKESLQAQWLWDELNDRPYATERIRRVIDAAGALACEPPELPPQVVKTDAELLAEYQRPGLAAIVRAGERAVLVRHCAQKPRIYRRPARPSWLCLDSRTIGEGDTPHAAWSAWADRVAFKAEMGLP